MHFGGKHNRWARVTVTGDVIAVPNRGSLNESIEGSVLPMKRRIVRAPSQPLDEDEQRAIVDDLRRQSEQIDWCSRWLFALVNAICFCLVGYCFLLLIIERPRALGEPSRLTLHAFLARSTSEVTPWLAFAYSCTMVSLACAALICLGSKKHQRKSRSIGVVAACGPLLTCGPTLVRLGAPLAIWWVALAAPAGISLAIYVDSDMARLARDVSDLNALRYRHKSV